MFLTFFIESPNENDFRSIRNFTQMVVQTVITMIYTENAPQVIGITGELTETQFQILREGIGAEFDSDAVVRVNMILGELDRLWDPDFYDQQIEYIIEPDRIINLDDTNWPQHPVNTFTYIVE